MWQGDGEPAGQAAGGRTAAGRAAWWAAAGGWAGLAAAAACPWWLCLAGGACVWAAADLIRFMVGGRSDSPGGADNGIPPGVVREIDGLVDRLAAELGARDAGPAGVPAPAAAAPTPRRRRTPGGLAGAEAEWDLGGEGG